MDPDSLNNYTRIVDLALEGAEPSWALLRQAMEQAMQLEFPKKRSEPRRSTEGLWTYRRILRSLPEVLLALADLHRQLKQRVVWRTWAAVARQSATARHAKRRKFEQRQQIIDEQLVQAEAKSSKDGSHSLYKVIRSFKTGKPNERVQLRDEQETHRGAIESLLLWCKKVAVPQPSTKLPETTLTLTVCCVLGQTFACANFD